MATGDVEVQLLPTNAATTTPHDSDPPAQEETAMDRLNRVRKRTDEFIHNRKVEIAILVLVILDAVIVLFELLIDLKAFGEKIKHSVLPEALHITSIVILSLFLIEVFVKVFALGKHFFKSPMNVIDGLIVIVSFVMDILFMKNEEWHDAIGLLIVLRLWRIVRIVNGIIQTVREQSEMKMEHKEKEIEKLKERIQELEAKLAVYEGEGGSESGGEKEKEKEKEEEKEEVEVKEEETQDGEGEMEETTLVVEPENCTVVVS